MYAQGPSRSRDARRAAAQPVTLEIDGVPVTVPAGTSVMRAAALADGDIPKLCATDTLKAFGSCRVCLVEIEGRKGFPASCTTEVAAGMKVRTQSEKLTQLRRGVLELYVSDHPRWAPARTPAAASSRHWRRRTASTKSRYAGAQTRAPSCTRRSRSTTAIRTSASTTTCASSARAACAPATKCRARSR